MSQEKIYLIKMFSVCVHKLVVLCECLIFCLNSIIKYVYLSVQLFPVNKSFIFVLFPVCLQVSLIFLMVIFVQRSDLSLHLFIASGYTALSLQQHQELSSKRVRHTQTSHLSNQINVYKGEKFLSWLQFSHKSYTILPFLPLYSPRN